MKAIRFVLGGDFCEADLVHIVVGASPFVDSGAVFVRIVQNSKYRLGRVVESTYLDPTLPYIGWPDEIYLLL